MRFNENKKKENRKDVTAMIKRKKHEHMHESIH